MFSPLLGADLREDALLAGYFFYGEEMFLADQFVDQFDAAGLVDIRQGADLVQDPGA